MADYWGKKFNDRLKLVEKELQLKEAKQSSSRFEMLRDVLNEKSNESAESYTDTPTTLTDNAEETIMIKGRVPRTVQLIALRTFKCSNNRYHSKKVRRIAKI